MNKSGQAVLEYVLLLSIVLSMFAQFSKYLSERDWFAKMTAPITTEYRYAYRYGHPKARGVDDGGQKFIAQHSDPASFRIFINPPTNR